MSHTTRPQQAHNEGTTRAQTGCNEARLEPDVDLTGWGTLAEPDAAPELAWLRVQTGQPQTVIVLSDRPISYRGHWHQFLRQFVRCGGAVCRHCLAGLGQQERFALAVSDGAGRTWAWEASRTQVMPIFEAVRGGEALRGMELALCRPGASRTAQVVVSVLLSEDAEINLAAAPDLAVLLEQQWMRQAIRLGKSVGEPASSQHITGTPAPARAGAAQRAMLEAEAQSGRGGLRARAAG